MNFFRAGANGGILLEPEESLLKGRTYFVLCAPRAWFSPPVGLFREVPRAIFCDPKREWIGFLVYLPRGKRLDIDSWCSSAGRDLIDPQSELDLVLPPARAIQPDGSFRIAAGQEVVLSLRGGDWIEPTVEVLAEETGESQEWELGIEADDYLRLGKFEPGTYAIHVRDWQMVSLRLTVVEATNSVIGGVVLRTASLDSKKELRATLPAHDASERWDAIMSGRELWRGIDSCPITRPFRSGGQRRNTPKSRVRNLPRRRRLPGLFPDCLAVDPSYATLDAGVFGTICYGEAGHRTKTPLIEGLPANLCSRLQWLALRAHGILARCLRAPSAFVLEMDNELVTQGIGPSIGHGFLGSGPVARCATTAGRLGRAGVSPPTCTRAQKCTDASSSASALRFFARNSISFSSLSLRSCTTVPGDTREIRIKLFPHREKFLFRKDISI